MPYDLKEIAAISGMPGLYRLVRPTRAGVIVETLDERAARSVASARNKVSLLQEISIYTEDYDQTVPLAEVFDRIYQQFGPDLAVTSKSDDRDLTAFMGQIIPDYDRQRVYLSDIKKLVTWYHAVSRRLDYQPAVEAAPDEPTPAETTAPLTDSAATEPAAAEPQAQPSDYEPAGDEALSTAGIIPTEADAAAAGNPEAASSAEPAQEDEKKAE